MTLVNGRMQDRIDVLDRGLAYGDGHFTTMRVWNGRIQMWDAHLSRLQRGCAKLAIDPPDWQALSQRVMSQVASMEQGCAKLMITRGSGGRGYATQGCDETRWILTTSPYPSHYERWQEEGVDLVVCQQVLGELPMLAGLKSLNRLEQVMLKLELQQRDAVEGIVLNTRKALVEGVSANLFWRRDKTVFTPDLTHSGVDGVMRRWVMGALKAMGIELRIVEAPLESLWHAEEVWLTNALMGLVPVNRIEQTRYRHGQLIRQLQERLLIEV